MSWKIDTENKAILAAQKYYDEVLVKAGLFPGELRRLPPSRDDAIMQLANEKLPAIQEKFPEKDYDEGAAKLLNSFDADKTMRWLYDYGDDPATAKRKDDFAAMKSLVDPDPSKGERSWMDMDRKELEHRMGQFGYDSRRKGDYNRFLDALASNQVDSDRAKVVKSEINGADPFTKFALAMYPTATSEATRQALTGDFDDSRVNRAMVTDAAAQAAFGGNTLSRALMASPVRIGFADAGVELARQAANAQGGFGYSPMAPVGAGVAAATVPAGAQWIGGYLSRGGSMAARPMARGFQRGLRGADDPLRAERNELKQLLVKAREDSRKGASATPETVEMGDEVVEVPVRVEAGIADLEAAESRKEAKRKLMALGLRSAEDERFLDANVARAQKKLDDLLQSQNQVIESKGKIPEKIRQARIDEIGTLADAAQKELDEARAARLDYDAEHGQVFGRSTSENPYVEQVIGGDPEYGQALPGMQTSYGIKDVLKNYYDEPVRVPMYTSTGRISPHHASEYRANLETLRAQFPEKYSVEAAMGPRARAYKTGLGAGRVFGTVGTQVEPNLRANPFQPDTYADRVTRFTESEWFRKLPENKKNAIEKALKGEK